MSDHPTVEAGVWQTLELRARRGPEQSCERSDQRLSGGRSVVVLQQTAESRSACNMALVVRPFGQRRDYPVAPTLMVAFVMVMIGEFTHRSSEQRFADKDDPIQTGLLDGADKSLRVDIEIR